MWNYMDGWWASGMGLFMEVFWLIVVVGVVALVWALVRAGSPSRAAEVRHADSALRILEERYARGEIGRDEFEQKKRDLG